MFSLLGRFRHVFLSSFSLSGGPLRYRLRGLHHQGDDLSVVICGGTRGESSDLVLMSILLFDSSSGMLAVGAICSCTCGSCVFVSGGGDWSGFRGFFFLLLYSSSFWVLVGVFNGALFRKCGSAEELPAL